MDFLSLTRGASALVWDVVSQKLVFWFSIEDLVVLILPLLAGVLSTHGWMLSSEIAIAYGHKVHVPNSDEEILELEILFKCLVHVLMVFLEFGTCHRLVTTEVIVGIVERGEHFKEAKAGLLG